MEIEGQISEIIYQNEINSYTVAVLETEEETVTIVGYLPFINIGDTLKLFGKFVKHQDYGEQFKVDTFEKVMPETLEALEKYLANGTIKGVGPATAKKIIDTFGDDTINIFKFEPKKLARIKGITEEKALQMSEEFMENWELWQIVGFLEKFGIGVTSARTIYKQLGISAIDEIESNPYILVDIIKNVDFKKIDKSALELGVALNNSKRVKSGIKYSLMKISYNGHCCCIKENLIHFVKELLGVTEEDIESSIIELKVKEEIVLEKRDEQEWIYLMPFYKAENNVAQRIMILQTSKNIKHLPFIDKELRNIEKKQNIELSEKQKEAVKTVNENNVTIITGGPGTGKTTIIKTIIDIYKEKGRKVILCAPTGRAAKKMSETTGEEAKTLHRLLDIGKLEDETGKVGLIDYDVAPIDGDILVVDEMSMVDLFLMNYLLKAIYQGTKLILVGDADQLPSVGPGSILKDLIESERIPTVHLDKIFRQAAKSKIILNAHRVNNGEKFINKEDAGFEKLSNDFFYINERNQEKIIQEVISLCKDRLKNYGNYDFFSNIQVLSPTKKGNLGTKELNKLLQTSLNPVDIAKIEKKVGDVIFREGDRIMQTKNNYEIYWEKKGNKYEVGSGIFNGELGKIETINIEEQSIKVKFDDEKIAWYTFQELEQLEHSYVTTIHKAQGSEFDVVIIIVPQTSPMLLTRNLLYTGLTRAKKMLIIIGPDNVINYMINNADTKIRNSGLEYKLRGI